MNDQLISESGIIDHNNYSCSTLFSGIDMKTSYIQVSGNRKKHQQYTYLSNSALYI